MMSKFKDADDYILKEYVKPTLKLYKDIDRRMDLLCDFLRKNYDKSKDKFYEVSDRYSNEFNRSHRILTVVIKEIKRKLKNKTMQQACDCIQENKEIMHGCTLCIFEYENKFREYGFLTEKFEVCQK